MSNLSRKVVDPLDRLDATFGKLGIASSTVAKRLVVEALPSLASSKSSAPSVNVEVVKLNDCEEEFDKEPREAKFAFRSTDLSSWASSSAAGPTNNTDSDPTTIQHWAVVVHFPRGKKTYLFEAWEDNKKLQPGRAEIAFKEIEIFEKATYFGTAVTSPSELLIKANQIPTGIRYDVLRNNCQTWIKDFVDSVSPDLLVLLYENVPATETCVNYLARQLEKLSKISS
uniref:Uncharacterized protein n=1 Tax=Daphnia galeata TaxID=27404 RepID=A0A8J2RXU3_9CRUS|nr:unnamed protein product [Daphnia galeata]